MRWTRSAIAVAAGVSIFAILFILLGPRLGAVLTSVAAGLMSGYFTAKIALTREVLHGGATAVLVAVYVLPLPVLPFPMRVVTAALAAAAITAGAWVRGQARAAGLDELRERERS